MWQAFGLGLWAGYGLAIPVGAVAVLLIHRSATATLRQGLAAVLGAVAADALYAVAALLGGAAAARLIAPWQSAVTVAGAGVLLVLAARIAIDGLTRDPADPERGTAGGGPKCGDGQPPRTAPGRAWREALLFFSLTALNPWPLLYFVSVVVSGGC
ncbi:LysE family transporter [Brevibacterium casei]|nr:LysE family transporter [Brevibacterium casei]